GGLSHIASGAADVLLTVVDCGLPISTMLPDSVCRFTHSPFLWLVAFFHGLHSINLRVQKLRVRMPLGTILQAPGISQSVPIPDLRAAGRAPLLRDRVSTSTPPHFCGRRDSVVIGAFRIISPRGPLLANRVDTFTGVLNFLDCVKLGRQGV